MKAIVCMNCGTGLICNELANQVKMIYAIDLSSKMIEFARDKALAQQIQNIEFIQTTII